MPAILAEDRLVYKLSIRIIANDPFIVETPAALRYLLRERREVPVVVRCPTVERMLVATRTRHAHAEKRLADVLHPVVRRTLDPVEVGRSHLVAASSRRDHLMNELIPGRVILYAVPDPFVEQLTASFTQLTERQLLRVDPQQIRKAQRAKIREFRTAQQQIDLTLSSIRAGIRRERFHLLLGRQPTERVQRHAPEKLGIAAECRGHHVERM